MKTRTMMVVLFVLALFVSPVVSAQMMGEEMMKGGQGEMKGMDRGQMQMMQQMDQMMDMMHNMMQHMQGMAQDKNTKNDMGEMMKRMEQMREQHQSMMKEQGMMQKSRPK